MYLRAFNVHEFLEKKKKLFVIFIVIHLVLAQLFDSNYSRSLFETQLRLSIAWNGSRIYLWLLGFDVPPIVFKSHMRRQVSISSHSLIKIDISYKGDLMPQSIITIRLFPLIYPVLRARYPSRVLFSDNKEERESKTLPNCILCKSNKAFPTQYYTHNSSLSLKNL